MKVLPFDLRQYWWHQIEFIILQIGKCSHMLPSCLKRMWKIGFEVIFFLSLNLKEKHFCGADEKFASWSAIVATVRKKVLDWEGNFWCKMNGDLQMFQSACFPHEAYTNNSFNYGDIWAIYVPRPVLHSPVQNEYQLIYVLMQPTFNSLKPGP